MKTNINIVAKRNTSQTLLLALGIAAALSTSAHAQYTNPYTGTTWNNPMSSYLDTVIMGNQQMSNLIIQQSINRSMLERSMKGKKGKSSSKTGKSGSKATPQAPAAPAEDSFESAVQATNFKFSPSPAVPQKMAELLIADAKDRPEATKVFGWCLQSAREDFRKNKSANLPQDNVARALAFFIISSRDLALTRPGEKIGQRVASPTIAQAQALRTQIALALSHDEEFKAKSNAQKQEMYEMLLIVPAYAQSVFGIGLEKGNVEVQEAGRSLARDSLKKLLNLKPERLRFSEAGLQLK